MARKVSHSDLIFNVGWVTVFVMEAIMHASMMVNLTYGAVYLITQ